MKKYLVIGNPIEHSLSPKLHNHWIKKNNLKATYDKKLLEQDEIKKLISNVREEKIHGLNVTVPFKKTVIPFLDELSDEARNSQSVNTIYKVKDKIIGENTDIDGFKSALEATNQVIKNKKVFILGAGGVVPSIIIALKKMQISKIYLSNRTELKALELKKHFPEIEMIEWGKVSNFEICPHSITSISGKFFFISRAFNFVRLLKQIFDICIFFKAIIIDGTTPPAPSINTSLFLIV